jgi:hypothetical protein
MMIGYFRSREEWGPHDPVDQAIKRLSDELLPRPR